MGDLVVVSGPPGSGKSTVSALLARASSPSALVPGDAFFAFLARGAVAPWLPEAHAQNEDVMAAAASAAGRLAAGDRTVVYDGVVGRWFLAPFLASTGLERLHYAVLLPPLEVCLHRVATRTGHGFTDAAAARHMHEDFARAEVDPRHLLAASPDDPAAVADAVLRRVADGTLLVRA